MFDKDRFVKGSRYNSMYNWYLGYRIWSSFWKFRPRKILGKRSKLLEEYFFAFLNLKTVQYRARSIYMQSFSLFGGEVKKLLASQKRDRFPVGPGRNLNRLQYTLK